MLPTPFVQYLLSVLAFIPNVSSQSDYSETHNPVLRTKLALETLQKWYNTSTGLWESTGWWNGANVLTMIGDFAKAAPGDMLLQDLARNVFATALLKAPAKNPQPGIEDTHDSNSFYHPAHTPDYCDWLDGYYDDDLWWALAWINAYDVTSEAAYLVLAEDIFIAVSRTWGTCCFNGGIYWSWRQDYVNAIANELFFSTAAHLANRVQGRRKRAVYLAWAEKSLLWFLKSGMMTENGITNDGLTADCENNGMTAWSYNQGVILGGLAELHRAAKTPHDTPLRLAAHISRAALVALADEDGVIHDECEPDCGDDGAQFKGIFMRNLVKLHSVAPDDVFAHAIRANAESIWEWDRKMTTDGLPLFSVNWAGPWVSPANASTQSSAMDALVAAIFVY
ncbi:hypothetical protein ACET3X_002180 [Alternaria dauci]|uniref:Glycoside hydrolase family 76 protein n=1 Tax=Alternaria dauci TaxID=48095 RepID=A0ABR3UNY7_9PLEO